MHYINLLTYLLSYLLIAPAHERMASMVLKFKYGWCSVP